jgi:hypothetical protein
MGGAGGNSAYSASAFEAVCPLTPRLWSLRLSPEALHAMRDLCERKQEVWARNGRPNFDRQSDFHVISGFFYMPHICDMGQTALLPLRRKACCGFFRPKSTTAPAGLLSTRTPKPLAERDLYLGAPRYIKFCKKKKKKKKRSFAKF